MVYLKSFNLVPFDKEPFCLDGRSIHNNNYPLGIFSSKEFTKIDFENITIFYGDNGSGKSTLLKIIASKLGAENARKNLGTTFDNYVNFCNCEMQGEPDEIKFISSDDVYAYMLDTRYINEKVNVRKEDLAKEYLNNRYTQEEPDFNDYENLKKQVIAQKGTMSGYIRSNLYNNTLVEQSNGETTLMYWQKI